MTNDLTNENLRARVFISCGQSKGTVEPVLAADIKNRLIDLGFDPYVAVGEQSLRGLKENLFEQLNRSEYFLFVDFKRERLNGEDLHRGSLFSHQELAVASFLNIDVLAFQEQGVKQNDGILGFIQGNAIAFSDRPKLPELVAGHVRERVNEGKWNPKWRNELAFEDSIQATDITNQQTQKKNRYFHLSVRNQHHSKAAMNCCAYLQRAVRLESAEEIQCKTFELKWEGYLLPNAHILPKTTRNFDAFNIQHDEPCRLQFHGLRDSTYYLPKIEKPGSYKLTYLVVADNFPPISKTFRLALQAPYDSVTLVT
ncbi:MAG: hypothetical protein WCC21_12500 [Candidatus Acidiferrales bacterium]